MATLPPWRPPEEFDEYRIVRELGAGAMGQVFLAHDTLLDRSVAVKFLGAGEISDLARERFLVEARALARLQHPNVVTVYRVGELGRRPYLVSEFIHGESLDRVAKPMPWRRVCELAIGLARGLAAAHRRGVLHRDIKPANTILASDDDEVKLLDFGLAKLVDIGPVAGGTGSLRPSPRTTPLSLPVATPAATPVPLGFDATQDFDAMGPTGLTPAPVVAKFLDDETRGSGSHPDHDRAQRSPSNPSLTRDGAVMGTPYYMAPEAWRGEQATARSDLYSLGVLLYELASGSTPHRDVPVINLAACVQVDRARTLESRVPEIDPRFAAIVDRCLELEPGARFGSADELREALEALSAVTQPTPTAVPEGNPYRGLRTFEAEHRAVFFGRDPEVRAVLERLRTDPFVLVAGDSGLGKSSLCRAGIAPAILDGALGSSRTWRSATIVPGRRPVVAIATELARCFDIDEATLEDHILRRDTVAIEKHRRAILKSLAKHQHGFLLVIDQLEELVTLADPAEAVAAVELLASLFASSSARGIRLLATVRGDFLTRVAVLPWLADEMTHALYVLRPMTTEGIREAILGPARAKGVAFEPAHLVDELVEAARTSGSLPLLQFALAELWEARPASARTITADALAAIGGVDGALARHADRVLDEMLPSVRAAARRLLLALVSADGTRARGTRTELVVDESSGQALELLVRGRLVSVRESEGEPGYELAHEALLARWDTLRSWLDDDGERRIVRRRVETAAAEWERLARTRDLLWGPRQLAELERIDLASLAPGPRGFVETSRRAWRSKQRRKALIVAAVPIVAIAIVLFIRNRVEAGDRKRRQAAIIERDRRVAGHTTSAASLQSAVDRDRAGLARTRDEAFAHFGRKELAAGEATWAEAGRLATALDADQARIGEEYEHALVIDPSRQEVRRRLAEVLYARAELADILHANERRDELLRRLALHDQDGALRRQWDAPGTLALDVGDGIRVEVRRVVGTNALRASAVLHDRTTPIAALALLPGSYVLALSAPGRVTVTVPVVLARGESRAVRLALPLPSTIPPGFVFVPGGRTLVGTAEEALRVSFLSTVPMHAAEVPAFLIAQHETTYADWIAYLKTLPPRERAQKPPKIGAGGARGSIGLEEVDGAWRLTFQVSTERYTALEHEPIEYRGRTKRARQNWLRFPVSGVGADDALAYAAWLDATGRVPGARLCTDHEWERAARGADGREFPASLDSVAPDDANFDETYNKQPAAFGPDEVGSHPASASLFGVHDMTGNIFEWVVSSLSPDPYAVRGGAFYFGQLTGRLTNRWLPEQTLRELTQGIRICATPASHP